LTMLGSVAWYGVSGTIAWYGLDIIEVTKNGVEELIIEGVEGARIVVQCFWWGALILAAMTIVYVGRAFLSFVSERMDYWRMTKSQLDSHELQYGRRLRGGTSNRSVVGQFQRNSTGRARAVPAQELDMDYLFGERPDPARRGCDLTRLSPSNVFSFAYSRGTRVGGRRTVKLVRIDMVRNSEQLFCAEMAENGVPITRRYWPALMSEVVYPGEEDPDRTTPPQLLVLLERARIQALAEEPADGSDHPMSDARRLDRGQVGGRATTAPLPAPSAQPCRSKERIRAISIWTMRVPLIDSKSCGTQQLRNQSAVSLHLMTNLT
jgi:hypothetical protein